MLNTSELSSLLDEVDWDGFEEEALLAVGDAVQHYLDGARGSNGEEVRQVYLITNPQSHVTSVGFETATGFNSHGGFLARRALDGGNKEFERVGSDHVVELVR